MKKIISIALIIVFVASTMSLAIPNVARATTTAESAAQGIFKDVDQVRSVALNTETGSDYQGHHSYYPIGTNLRWMCYDDFYGGVFVSTYKLRYISAANCSYPVEIWTQNNINWGNPSPWTGTFDYGPEWRSNPPYGPTDEQIAYLAQQWETVVLPTDTQYFGAPGNHTGVNAQLPGLIGYPSDAYVEPGGRAVILVANIRDANYYLPNYYGPGQAYPYKVIGVHIGDYEDYYFDRNIITIDAISWRYQLGPPGKVWTGPWGNATVLQPYAYESTIAHEWQHCVHHYWAPGDATFMNEGCSMFAEYLCGYGIDPSYLNAYFATPDNSLTLWGDQGDINILADYGAAALWTIYLNDHFGGPSFISYYVSIAGTYHGIDGINYALAHFKYREKFDAVYCDWKLANLIRQDYGCMKKWNYQSINLNDPTINPIRQYAIGGLPVPQTKGTDFGNSISYIGDDTGVSMIAQYGSDYIRFENWTKLGLGYLYFDGDDNVYLPGWTMTADGWWSGTGINMQEAYIVGTATVSSASPILTIVTKYDLEPYWDFGFTQVSTNNGQTWTSLSNSYTTSDYLTDVTAIQANMPGLTDQSPGYPSWTTMSFDLTAYASKTVKIRFLYMTDEATTHDGWWIQSVTVSGNQLTLSLPPPPKATFQVTVVQATVFCGKTYYLPYDLCLTDPGNKGMTLAFANRPNFVVLIVTPTAAKGLNDYKFQATKTPLPKFTDHRMCGDFDYW